MNDTTHATSPFHAFALAINANFAAMCGSELYTVDAPNLTDLYLESFPEGTNPMFRERTEHDCTCCKGFIKNIGNVVAITGNGIMTVWDAANLAHPYDVVAAALADHVRSKPITSVFRTEQVKHGKMSTVEERDGVVHRWNHFFCDVPAAQVTATPDADRGKINTNIGVYKRALEELSMDSVVTVLDLIDTGSLYRGDEHRDAVAGFKALLDGYPRFSDNDREKEIYTWNTRHRFGAMVRNTVIGSLLIELSDGMDIELAVDRFEKKMAGDSYKRPTAIITSQMVEQANKKLEELGLSNAIYRRLARLSDVSINSQLWVDNAVKPKMKDGLAGLLAGSVKPAQVDINHGEEINMDDFLSRVLPKASSIDLLVKNQHLGNFVTVTAPEHDDSGLLFKWDNRFAWSYDGDVADSIKQRVKRAGGNVDAELRISLGWFNTDDLDIHVFEPNGNEISFRNKCGKLDVDMNAPHVPKVRDPVENVSFVGRVADGEYIVVINQFQRREYSDVGFVIEVENRGRLDQYTYSRSVVGSVKALKIIVEKGEISQIWADPALTYGAAKQEKWGISTETLVPVETIMTSPNHWSDGHGVGNFHWFFMLKGCRTTEPVRGIYNEFLKAELEPHRKVFEAVGAKTKCQPTDDQISGLGFSSTGKGKVTVVVKGEDINKAFNISF